MCNSLHLQFSPPSKAAKAPSSPPVCSNTQVIPHFSIGKILPRPNDLIKQENTPQLSCSPGKTVPRSVDVGTRTVSIEENEPQGCATQQLQTITIESLRQGQNLAASKLPFLWKLHLLLDDVEATGNDHIVSWLEHGRSFKVYRPKSFISTIAPLYFKQSKFKSFQRQLHLYEFTRTAYGPEAGSYGHPLFVRGQPNLCLSLGPIKIKGKTGRQQRQRAAKFYSNPSHRNKTEKPVVLIPPPSVGVATAVLSKREQDEWVAKIQQMVVKGSALAAELHRQKQEQEIQPPLITSYEDKGPAMDEPFPYQHPNYDDDTCSVFGANFHLLPHQEDVSSCEHCCESDTEAEEDWTSYLLQAE